MQYKKRWIPIALMTLVVAILSGFGIREIPGMYARHILKKSDIELSSKEFVAGACREDIGTVVLMLEAGMNVNVMAQDERRGNIEISALHCAAAKGNLKLINLLLNHGAKLESGNQIKETPLLAAVNASPKSATSSNFDAINALLAKGAQINAQSDNGTVLHAACRMGNMNLVKFLLDHGADPALLDDKGDSALTACTINTYNAVDVPFDRLLPKGINIDAVGQAGTTMLSRAVQSGNIKLADRLLALGANPNVLDQSGDPPLFYAVRNMEMMGILINKGADVNLNGKNGTALLAALRAQSMPAVALLLARGADTKVTDPQGNTPLHLAAQNPNMTAAIPMLLDGGAPPNAVNLDGNTPLHLAARNRIAQAVDLLLANGARVNEKNDAGQTPLELAKGGAMQVAYPMSALQVDSVRIAKGRSAPPSDIEKNLRRHGAK